MSRIAIIDYGMGNLHSMAKAVERVGDGAHVFLASDALSLRRADKVIFPGVGAIAPCMAELARLELDTALVKAAASKPLLGVCLGMQALLDHSDESNGVAGLGLIAGNASRLPDTAADNETRCKVPHMGWNRVHQTSDHPLWLDIAQDSQFYFVHSYHAVLDNADDVEATTRYGRPFVAAFAHENIVAVQFHPEKSQSAGLHLLANFIDWNP
ncbi:MAG TPA: imidazole glycerol phosphate synthase subunit HisH [Gammaproteobacteria bacterium]|nr:imidazole glycerol phosphate synthase subunit HisH [Gammaproteobacteria bacterium]